MVEIIWLKLDLIDNRFLNMGDVMLYNDFFNHIYENILMWMHDTILLIIIINSLFWKKHLKFIYFMILKKVVAVGRLGRTEND